MMMMMRGSHVHSRLLRSRGVRVPYETETYKKHQSVLTVRSISLSHTHKIFIITLNNDNNSVQTENQT